MEHMIPPVLEIREHKSYLRRLTALQACSMISSVIDEDTARSEVLPIVLEMANDGVSGSLVGCNDAMGALEFNLTEISPSLI